MTKKYNKLSMALLTAVAISNNAYGQNTLQPYIAEPEQSAISFDNVKPIKSPPELSGSNSIDNNASSPDNSQGIITIGSVTDSEPMNTEHPHNTQESLDTLKKPSAIAADFSKHSEAISGLIQSNPHFIQWQGMNNRIRSLEEVSKLYDQLNFQFLWTENGKITNIAEQVINAAQGAPNHALRPETYHNLAISSLKAGQVVSEPEKFDLIISDAFITLKSHLANGIVPPKKQFSTWNKKREQLNFVELYLAGRTNNNIRDILSIKDQDYNIIQKAYISALNSPELENFVKIPAKKLKPQQHGYAVSILRMRLGLDESINIYDTELKQAVKDFQMANKLKADGVAGKNTLHLLNQSPKEKLQTLAINLERYRWSYTPDSAYVWVNIPAFKMAIRKGNQKLFTSNVIVGRPKRPTPIFSDQLENVVLAPYWNVPSTIFKEDKLPKLKKNPNAFGNMQVLNTSTGQVVNANSVDWSEGGKGYRLRQKPGARNALGRMKFLFPNKHAIYLHDTPGRRLFKRSRRAFSSGCIRVERAEDLAIFLLDDIGYDRNRVKKESRGGREKWIRLGVDKQYPVFLEYYTAWVDDENQVRFSSDLYGYDKKLKKLYDQALQTL